MSRFNGVKFKKNKIMKKRVLIRMFLNTLILYSIVYLVTCFIKWEIFHPFQWVIDIPTKTGTYRTNVFFCWFFYTLTNAGLTYFYISDKEGFF